jgi:hypothetical protein
MLILLSIVVCTFILCFTISHIFLSVFLYEDKKELRNFKNDIFSYIFGFSNILLILIVCEIANIDNFQFRSLIWTLFLWLFIAIMFYIIPYFFLSWIICGDDQSNLQRKKFSFYFRKFGLILVYIAYLVSANKFLFLIKKKEDDFGFLLFYILPTYMMEYLSIVGIITSAILSGYGSTHCILNFLVYPFFRNSLEKQHKKFKERLSTISEEISLKENELHLIQNSENFSDLEDNNPTDSSGVSLEPTEINIKIKNRKESGNQFLLGTMKGVYNYVIGKDNKKDMQEEIDELKALYSEMEMQVKLVKEKTISFRNNFISGVKYFFQVITGKILAFYCIYRIVMTIKNLLFQNYSDINVMLKEELLNIIDFSLNIVFSLLKVDVETIYYTVIEQYFSLLIVGSIIIVNIRSFLNTILFIYTKTLKNYNTKLNKKAQSLFLSYFVGLFYVTSSIFLIFNLPITYR